MQQHNKGNGVGIMPDKQTLLDLAERVEAGENNINMRQEINEHLIKPTDHNISMQSSMYTWMQDGIVGSLDAAKTLHDAVLPGWGCELIESYDGTWWNCYLFLYGRDYPEQPVAGEAPTPASITAGQILRGRRRRPQGSGWRRR